MTGLFTAKAAILQVLAHRGMGSPLKEHEIAEEISRLTTGTISPLQDEVSTALEELQEGGLIWWPPPRYASMRDPGEKPSWYITHLGLWQAKRDRESMQWLMQGCCY